MRLHILQRQREPERPQPLPHMLRHPVLVIQPLHSAPPERFHQSPLRLSARPKLPRPMPLSASQASIPCINARVCGHPRIATSGVRAPAQCVLHKQAARAKVARSSRRCSRRSCSASQRTPPRTGATHRQAHSAAPCAVLLHATAARKRSASAAAGACCAVTLRTAPSPLRSLRSLRGLSAGSASPVPGLAPQGEEMSEKNARNSVGN